VGYISDKTIITDSYALGDVEVDNPFNEGSDSGAGGLIGCVVGDAKISKCFAKGQVIALTNSSGTNMQAGGLIGTINNASVIDSVAINKAIVRKGPEGKGEPGRICGIINSLAVAIDNNYALNAIHLGIAYTYFGSFEYFGNLDYFLELDPTPPLTPPLLPAGTSTNKNGEDLTAADLAKEDTWFNAIFAFSADDGNPWSASGIARGYPRLKWEFE
jgi:hypothetical protein